MKLRNLLAASLILLFVSGCASWRNGSPPTKTEAQLFTVTTNYVPAVVTVTNPPTAPGLPPTITTQTNQIPTYTYTPGPTIKDVQTGVGLIPGYGGLAGTAIGALAALWAWFRGSKNYNTGATLAQSIEAIREVIKTLPNGAAIDSQLTTWLQQHQNDTGTTTQVLSMLENDVSNPDAKAAAAQIIAAINALNPSALPPGTSVKA